jgi:hypothetical protein
MIDRDEVQKRASAYVAKFSSPSNELVVVPEATLERSFGWVFFCDSKRFMETGNILFALAGNAPLVVDRYTGDVPVTGTAEPLQNYIAAYERTGNPHS